MCVKMNPTGDHAQDSTSTEMEGTGNSTAKGTKFIYSFPSTTPVMSEPIRVSSASQKKQLIRNVFPALELPKTSRVVTYSKWVKCAHVSKDGANGWNF